MRALIAKYRELIAYLFFGVLTTLVNIGSYYILSRMLPALPKTVPSVAAMVLSILFAYLTNRRWVFASRATGARAVAREALAFFSARLFTLLVDTAIMLVAVDILHLHDLAVKVAANVVVVVLNYFLSKFWVFRKKDRDAP